MHQVIEDWQKFLLLNSREKELCGQRVIHLSNDCIFIFIIFRYIRIKGTYCSVNKVFHLVHFECLYTTKPFTVTDEGIVGRYYQRNLQIPDSPKLLWVDNNVVKI